MRLLTLFLVLAAVGCGTDPQSPRGFSLPVGDVARGEATFAALECQACHRMEGLDFPPATVRSELEVPLGGETPRVKTYGELVTSIINPSHRLVQGMPREEVSDQGVSRMTVYNDVMTVTQLIDLVAFLESHYELRPYDATDYPMLP